MQSSTPKVATQIRMLSLLLQPGSQTVILSASKLLYSSARAHNLLLCWVAGNGSGLHLAEATWLQLRVQQVRGYGVMWPMVAAVETANRHP
jgi:hypothetical protein